MEGAAYGKFQLTPASFYDLTPWEFFRFYDGYTDRTYDLWRIARWQGWITVVSVMGKKAPEPEKLLPLPGDQKKAREVAIPIKADNFISLFTKRHGGITQDKKTT